MVLRLQKSLGCSRNFFYPWRHSKITLLYYLDIPSTLFPISCNPYDRLLGVVLLNILQFFFSYAWVKKINKSIFYIFGWSLKCEIDRTISLKGKEAYFSAPPFLQQILSCLVLFSQRIIFRLVSPSERMLNYSKFIYTVLF